MEQGSVTITNRFSDYREVEGMMVPFQTESEGMSPVPLTMKVEEVNINTWLEDDFFKVDKE